MESDYTQTAYRQCFSTDSGKLVLSDMLIESGMFDKDVDNSEVRNFAVKILHKAGICSNPQSVDELVRKMFEMRIN